MTSNGQGGRSGMTPPYSEEVEKGVLGSILLDSERVMALCLKARVVAESFFVPAHRVIFETVLEMVHASQPIDVHTVKRQLKPFNWDRITSTSSGRTVEISAAAFPNGTWKRFEQP